MGTRNHAGENRGACRVTAPQPTPLLLFPFVGVQVFLLLRGVAVVAKLALATLEADVLLEEHTHDGFRVHSLRNLNANK